MLLGAAITALGWQLLLTIAGVVVAHQLQATLRPSPACCGGLVLGLLAWLALQATVMVYAIEIDVVRSRRLVATKHRCSTPLTRAGPSPTMRTPCGAERQRPEQVLDVAYPTDEKQRRAD